jgi:hypothetical protein
MRGRAAAASAGAAAILGLPVVGAGVGSGADDGGSTGQPPATEPREARPNQVARLQDQLEASQRRVRYWRRKARFNWRLVGQLRAVVRQGYDPVRAGLLCIHSGEGAWSAATGNGYFGGLQMDRTFMATYGRPLLQRFGPAHRWPPYAQVAVAEVAYYSGRGYGPWPNTRRRCGL